MTQKSVCDIYRVEAVEAFRLGMEGKGSDALMRLMDCLAPVLEANGDLLGSNEVELLNHIVAAQQRGDYIFVADLLEHVFPGSVLGSL
jgi:hypothetical protein